MKIRWTILMTLLAVCLTFAALAETVYIDGLTADRVHLRQAPSDTAESLGLYFTGTPVERLSAAEGGWSRVRIGTVLGYVRTQFLATEAEAAFPQMVVDNRTSDWVNLRGGASFDAAVLARVNNGEPLLLMGETASGWSYVSAAGQRGYIVTEFLSGVEAGGTELRTQIVGTTAEGGYIHACEAEAGEVIYFVAMEADPGIAMEDVNFDGRSDLVITTVRGATNFYYEFFVRTQSGYVRAEYPPVITGIANYSLDPVRGCVVSSVNGGNAGALYEDCILRWEGTTLQLVRIATSQSLHEYRSEGATFITTVHDRKLVLTVWSCEDGESVLIHEEIIDMSRIDADTLSEMKQRLWQGL